MSDASSRGAASRRRGADAERAVVRYLIAEGWPDVRRYLAGDGRQPGDIDWHPLICLEVKDQARSSWPTWCRQAVAEAPGGLIPMVVRRTRGVPDVGAWECRFRGWAWFRAFDASAHSLPGAVVHLVDDWPWIATTFGAVVGSVRDRGGAR